MFRLFKRSSIMRVDIAGVKASSDIFLSKVPPIIFVLGGPGSGKGTQCERVVAAASSASSSSNLPSHLYHINVGGLLRDAQKDYDEKLKKGVNLEGTHLGKAGPVLVEMMSTGNILPSWVTVTILKAHLETIARDTEQGLYTKEGRLGPAILIDGFPRSAENFEQFEEQIGSAQRLIVVDVPEDAMVNRIQKRGLSSGRSDDQSLDTIRKRVHVYNSETAEVIAKFNNDDMCHLDVETQRRAISVDGDRTPDEVEKDFIKAILELLEH